MNRQNGVVQSLLSTDGGRQCCTRSHRNHNTEINTMNSSVGCCSGLRAQLNAEKLQKLLQILRFLPKQGSPGEMSEFEAILEDVKNFLRDVDEFLTNTLKKEKLKRDTTARKDELLNQLNGLRNKLPPERIPEDLEEEEEYSDVQGPSATSALEDSFIMIEGDTDDIYDDTAPVELDTTASSSDHDQTMKTESGEQDDNGNDIDDNKSINNWDEADPYGDMKIAPIGVSELDSPYKSGWLEKKRKEGNIGLPGWQRRFCVIKSNILYYFKKEADKKQCGCIVLNGYEGRPATKQKKNQFFFDVIAPGKRSFQFFSKTESDMQEWIDAIARGSSTPPDVSLAEMGTTAGSVSNASSSSRENLLDNQELEMNTTADTDDFYDDTADTNLQPQSSMDSKDFGETYEVVETTLETTGTGSSGGQDDNYAEDDELYEDVATTNIVIPGRPPKQEARKPEPVPPSPKLAPLPVIPTTNLRSQPPLPVAPVPVPTTSTTTTTNSQIIPTNGNLEPWEEDYDNIYIGKWDCNPDDKDELGFKRGDLLHIISREYDVENWWVAEKHSKVGLVPKDYLMKAYLM